MRNIKINEIFKHFKGHLYRVITTGYDSEKYNEENPEESKMVVYEDINSKKVWIRPYDMFNSKVDKEKYPDVTQEYRFEDINKTYIDRIKTGVGIVIIKDNKVLLGHRCSKKDTGGIYEPDTWTLPGGKQEVDETILETAVRETKEETNLDISDLEVFGADDDISIDRHFVTLYVLARKYSGELKAMEPEKENEWKWFDLDNLPENMYSPSEKTLKVLKKRRGN